MRPDSLILHFRPRTVPERTLRFKLTWALGGSALVLVLVLAFTGVLMRFVYQPVPIRAYASVVALQQNIWFGKFVRSLHHISANLLVLVVFVLLSHDQKRRHLKMMWLGLKHGLRGISGKLAA